MNQVLEWVKANVLIVVFVAIMLIAPVAMFFVSRGMNESVRADVNRRASELTSLNGLFVTMPDGQRVLPNDQLVQKLEENTRKASDDQQAVARLALEFNQKSHKPLMDNVFPEPPFELREVIPKRFHERLVGAYDALLTDARAGNPPALESLAEQLQRRRTMFITQDLKKDPGAALEPDEEARLKATLTDMRIELYRDEATRIGLYASRDVLFVPAWDQTRIPDASQMFNWQWQYWIIEDVLGAIRQANKDAESVIAAPVKQVLGIVVHDLPDVGGESGSGSAAAPSGGSESGFGGFGGASATPPMGEGMGGESMGGDTGMGAAPPGAGGRDYSSSFTGLVTTATYDVIPVDVGLVVATASLPQALDALSRYNFFTITNLRVEPVDAFAAIERGYFFGSEPVCTVTLRLESVWLRDWTRQYMPPATRQALGIAPDAPAAPADPNAPPPQG
jgi:hypothetical protein